MMVLKILPLIIRVLRYNYKNIVRISFKTGDNRSGFLYFPHCCNPILKNPLKAPALAEALSKANFRFSMATLIFRLTPGESLEFSLDAPVTRLGRHASNEIVINNTWISSFHAEFRRAEDGSISLHDLQSSNGTSVNGEAVTSRELHDGDRIGFGQVDAVYQAEEIKAATPAPAAAPVAAPAAAPAPSRAPAKPAAGVAARAPVVTRPMQAPPASIAYDTVRKEGALELEALKKQLDEAGRATAEAEKAATAAVKQRADAEAALQEVQDHLKQAEAAREEQVRVGEAARLALEEEKTRLQALLGSEQAKLAALAEQSSALAAELERLEKSVSATRQREQAAVAAAEVAQRKDAEALDQGRAVLQEQAAALAEQRAILAEQAAALAAGKAALETLAHERTAAETARAAVEAKALATAEEARRESEHHLEQARLALAETRTELAEAQAERQRAAADRDAARAEEASCQTTVTRLQAEAEQWNLTSSAWPQQAAAAKAELAELEQSLTNQRAAIREEESRHAALAQSIPPLEAQVAGLKNNLAEAEAREAAAALLAVKMAEQETQAKRLIEETEASQATVTAARAAVAATEARGQQVQQELDALQARLELLRQETQGAEALNSKVADLRQQQGEAERRLAFLDDRLSGMSEAPDPNWGTVHSLARSFIRKLDLIDDLIAHLTGQPEASGTLDQLQVFRAGLVDILNEYSIESYSLEPGTVIDVAARKRIQIVETLSEGSHDGTRVVRTYRPGYVCLNGDLGISTLLRKADVAVSIPLS